MPGIITVTAAATAAPAATATTAAGIAKLCVGTALAALTGRHFQSGTAGIAPGRAARPTATLSTAASPAAPAESRPAASLVATAAYITVGITTDTQMPPHRMAGINTVTAAGTVTARACDGNTTATTVTKTLDATSRKNSITRTATATAAGNQQGRR